VCVRVGNEASVEKLVDRRPKQFDQRESATATQLLLAAVIDHENDALRRRLAPDDGERSDRLRHAPLQSNTYSCP
jgi:hypothetical protein